MRSAQLKRREVPENDERGHSESTQREQASTDATSAAEPTEAQVTDVRDTSSEEDASTTDRAKLLCKATWSSQGTLQGNVPYTPPPRKQPIPPGLTAPQVPPLTMPLTTVEPTPRKKAAPPSRTQSSEGAGSPTEMPTVDTSHEMTLRLFLFGVGVPGL